MSQDTWYYQTQGSYQMYETYQHTLWDWLQILLECEKDGNNVPRLFATRAYQLFDIVSDVEIENDLLTNLDWYARTQHSIPRNGLMSTLRYYGHENKIKQI